MQDRDTGPEAEADRPIEIHRLRPGDEARLRTLALRCYPPFYAYLWHPGAMDAYLSSAFDPLLLAGELTDPNLVYEIAHRDGEDLGFLKWHRRADTDGLVNAAYLERVYVTQESAGTRVGSMLIERALVGARGEGRAWIWLRAMANIDKVLARYRAAGFETCGQTALTTDGIRAEHAAMVMMRCALD